MKIQLVSLLAVLPLSLFAQIDHQLLEETKAAANSGCGISARQLGEWFMHGAGVPQDMVAAARWFRRSAELGDAEGQSYLGSCYLEGEGVPQDFTQAYVWLSLAVAANGGAGDMENRDRAASKLSPDQLAAAQKEAARLSKEIERKIGPLR